MQLRGENYFYGAAGDNPSVKPPFANLAVFRDTFTHCVKRVVATHSNIFPGHNTGPPLAYQYMARADSGTVTALHTEVLRL